MALETFYTHGTVRIAETFTFNDPPPRLPILGCSRFPIVVDSMHPRHSVNKVFFRSGVFGTLPPFRFFPVRSFVGHQSSPRGANWRSQDETSIADGYVF